MPKRPTLRFVTILDVKATGAVSHPRSEGAEPPSVSRPAARDIVFADFSVYEPSGLSLVELGAADVQNLPVVSQYYRRFVDGLVAQVRPEVILRLLREVAPLNGHFWGEQTARMFHERVIRSMERYGQRTTVTHDAVTTLEEFLMIYRSIYSTLAAPLLQHVAIVPRGHLVYLLVYILEYIISSNTDVRESRVSATQHFAGGQHEYHLYLRFASSSATWNPFLEILWRLKDVPALRAFFVNESGSACLTSVYRQLHERQRAGTIGNQSASDLFGRIVTLLQSWAYYKTH